LHEKKREVYVVTHVDECAWPSGVGAIRFGFSASKRQQFDADADFIEAYRAAVRAYHRVRRELDNELDGCRTRDGIALDEPVSAPQTQRWLAELPQDLRSREATLRAHMDAFTSLRELRVGDVLAVSLRTPHALQHGVRTVEFQTPVYERKILSFAQKVLTQDHWDTDEALRLAQLHIPGDDVFPVLHNADGINIEQIVAFDDFTVQRIFLEPGAVMSCERQGDHALMMVVSGDVTLADTVFSAEQAALIPASATALSLINHGKHSAVCLLALPV